MSGDHIVRSYDEELNQLTSTVQQVMSLAEEQIGRALKAVSESDESLAKEVIDNDQEIDLLEREAHRMGARLIALREPKGGDLRKIIASMRTVVDVERVGDYAVNVVKLLPLVREKLPEGVVDELERMGVIVTSMLRELRQAFGTGDMEKAVEIWKQDDEVDELYVELMTHARSRMERLQNGERLELYKDVVFMAKALERMGDHLTNVAEHIYEMVLGLPMEHPTRP
ncbi:MAG: phosphate signaling complex protein PhoU [Pseudomonadota bacterium]